MIKVYNGIERPEHTPDMIDKLREDEVFVFGSNLAGMHGGGAAYLAFKKLVLLWDVASDLGDRATLFLRCRVEWRPSSHMWMSSLRLLGSILSCSFM